MKKWKAQQYSVATPIRYSFFANRKTLSGHIIVAGIGLSASGGARLCSSEELAAATREQHGSMELRERWCFEGAAAGRSERHSRAPPEVTGKSCLEKQLASQASGIMLHPAWTPRVRMSVEAEKKK
jgi:hypothetical protein